MADRFEDGNYKNWIKSMHCQVEMKEALHKYLKERCTQFCRKQRLNISETNGGFDPITNTCGCKTDCCVSVSECKCVDDKKLFKVGFCQTRRFCHEAVKELFSGQIMPKIFWENTCLCDIITNEWAIAKLFMPKGSKDCAGPEKADAAAILRVLDICPLFEPIDHQLLDDLKEIRNKLCHSCDNKVEYPDMVNYLTRMINLLQFDNWTDGDTISLKENEECQVGSGNIKEMMDTKIDVKCFEDKALKAQRKSIKLDLATAIDENAIKYLRKALSSNRMISDEHRKDENSKLRQEIAMLQKQLSEASLERDDLKNQIDRLRLERSTCNCPRQELHHHHHHGMSFLGLRIW